MDKKSWIDWIKKDLTRGCKIEDVKKTLKDNNFSDKLINEYFNISYLEINKYNILEHFHKIHSKLINNFLFKKYKNDKLTLFKSNNFISDEIIEQINESDTVNKLNHKINKIFDIAIYEISNFEIFTSNEYLNNFLENNNIITWYCILCKTDTSIKFSSINKTLKFKKGNIIIFSNFYNDKKIKFKILNQVYLKKFFKII